MRGRNYSRQKSQPYVRLKYIKGKPMPKIAKFVMGNTKGKFQCKVLLISNENIQVRHNALEAVRVATNKVMQDNIGTENYALWIKPYPHIVLRENKMIFGAHADRLQDGMRNSFGKAIGTAARVNSNQPIIFVAVNKTGIEIAKKALKRGGAKLPTPCNIDVKKIMKI